MPDEILPAGEKIEPVRIGDDPITRATRQIEASRALKLDPAKEGKLRDFAADSGLNISTLRSVDFDRIKDAPDVSTLNSTHPHVVDYLGRKNNAAISSGDDLALAQVDDLAAELNEAIRQYEEDELKRRNQGSVLQNVKESFEYGDQYLVEFGLMNFHKYVGPVFDAPPNAFDGQLEATQQRFGNRREPYVFGESFKGTIGSVITTTTEQLPVLSETLNRGAKYGASTGASAMLFAAAAGQAGPQIGAPEEIITVPLAGLKGFLTGAFIGGTAETSFLIEAGHMAHELSTVRDDEGNGLDPNVIRGVALGVGAINAGLETVSFGRLTSIIPGLGSLKTEAKRAIMRRAIRKALGDNEVRTRLAQLGAETATAVGIEALTEGAQEAVNILGAYVATEINVGTFSGRPDVFTAESFDRIFEAARKGLAGGIGLAALPAIARIPTEVAQASRTQKFVDGLNKLSDAVSLSNTKERSAEAMKEFLQIAGADRDAYLSPEDARLILGDERLGAELEAVGITPTLVQAAEVNGQELVVPVADLLAKVDSDSQREIIQFLKPVPGGMSMQTIQQFSAGDLKLAMDVQSEAQHVRNQSAQELSRLRTQINKVFNFDRFAGDATTILRQMAFYFQRHGFDGADFLSRVNVSEVAHPAALQTRNEFGEVQGDITQDFNNRQKVYRAARAKGRTAINVADQTYNIELFRRSRNQSTLLHETGHVFIEELDSIVRSGRATDGMQQDIESLQKWFGSIDAAKGLSIEQHEQFAKGFEAYLMEGKAPNLQLESAFRRFAMWLSRIYRTVASLNVRLNDDVRRTFDRILATEKEIEDAAFVNQLIGITDEEIAALGVTPELRAKHRQKLEDAKRKAIATLERRRNKDRLKRRVQYRKEAEELVDAEPVYVASEFLRQNGKLRLSHTKAEYGQDTVNALRKKGLVAKAEDTGNTADSVASAHGFETGEDLILALLEAPSRSDAISQLVNVMEAEHDAQFTAIDTLIDTQAFNAIINDTEEFLKKKVPGRETRVERAAIKAQAEKAIAATNVKEAMRSDRYLGQMQRHLRAERKAIVDEDFVRALDHNQKARMNFELAKLSRNIRDEVQKGIKRGNRDAAAKPGRIEEQHHMALIKMLLRFNMLRRTPAKLAYDTAKPLRDIIGVDGTEVLDTGPAFNDFIFEEDAKQDYRTLTVANMREVIDAIRFLSGNGRAIVNRKLFETGLTKQEVLEKVLAPTAGKKLVKPVDEHAFLGSIRRGIRSFFASTEQLQFTFLSMDNFANPGDLGPNESLLWNPLAEAFNKKQELFRELTPKLDEVLVSFKKSLFKHPKKILNTGVPVPALMYDNGQHWTFERIYSIALNMGNDGNREAVKRGYDLTDEQLDQLTRSVISNEDWTNIQRIWDLLESLYPRINEVHRSVNHFSLPRVVATPFTTPTGQQLRGGYYPLKYDKVLSDVVAGHEELFDQWNDTQSLHNPAATNKPFVKARKGSGGLPPHLSLYVFIRHLDFVGQYISHEKTVKDINSIISDPAYKKAVADVRGKDTANLLKAALRYAARPEGELTNAVDSWFESQRRMATPFILGFNFSVALKQPYSIFAAVREAGLYNFMKGLGRVVINPIEARRFMRAASTQMETRSRQYDRDAVQAVSRTNLRGRTIAGVNANNARDSAFILIRMMDFLTVLPAWHAGYVSGLKRHGGDPVKARQTADNIIAATQPISRPIDLSQLQRSNRGWSRLFTMFSTFTLKFGNRYSFHHNRWRAQGGLGNPKATLEYMGFVATEAMVPPILMKLMFLTGWNDFDRDRDEESVAEELAWEVGLYQFIGMPIVRDVVNSGASIARGKFRSDPWDSPAFTGLELGVNAGNSVTKWVQDLDDDDKWVDAVWAFSDLASFKTGVPASRVFERTIEGMRQFEEGDGTPFNILIPNPNKRER